MREPQEARQAGARRRPPADREHNGAAAAQLNAYEAAGARGSFRAAMAAPSGEEEATPLEHGAEGDELRACTSAREDDGTCCSTSFLSSLRRERKSTIKVCRIEAKKRAGEKDSTFSIQVEQLCLCLLSLRRLITQ